MEGRKGVSVKKGIRQDGEELKGGEAKKNWLDL